MIKAFWFLFSFPVLFVNCCSIDELNWKAHRFSPCSFKAAHGKFAQDILQTLSESSTLILATQSQTTLPHGSLCRCWTLPKTFQKAQPGQRTDAQKRCATWSEKSLKEKWTQTSAFVVFPGSSVDGRWTAWRWKSESLQEAAKVWPCHSTPTSCTPSASWGGGQPSRWLQRV